MSGLEVCGACKKLLRKLYNRRCFGGKHTEEKNLFRAITHLPKREQKKALNDWELCKKQGLVIVQMKTNEPHASLNPKMLREIDNIIGLSDGEGDEDD